jgi:hypothetical protein
VALQRICLLTAYDAKYEPIAAITVPQMRAFAERHSYEFRIVEFERCDHRNPWLKIDAIRASLREYFDFIVWLDVDALILRFDVDVRSVLPNGADLFMAWHGPDTARLDGAKFVSHYNSGVLVIRSGDWARDFFDRVMALRGKIEHEWTDQAAIHQLLGYHSVLRKGPDQSNAPDRAHVARLDTMWNSILGVAMAEDPVIHHYAGMVLAARIRILELDAAILPLRSTVGPSFRGVLSHQISLWRHDAWRAAEWEKECSRISHQASEWERECSRISHQASEWERFSRSPRRLACAIPNAIVQPLRRQLGRFLKRRN